MARGPHPAAVALTADERAALERSARRPKSSQALASRARIVLACADHPDAPHGVLAAGLGVTRQTVGKWRERFAAKRLDGVLDEPRVGAPRTITDAAIEAVVGLTLETAPPDGTHWRTRGMAERAGVTQTAVSRIWRGFALDPHRAETFKLSKDPPFIAKVRDIVRLYLHPPACAGAGGRREDADPRARADRARRPHAAGAPGAPYARLRRPRDH